MAKYAKLLRGEEDIYMPLEDYLLLYHSELEDGWTRVQVYVNKAFAIQSEEDYISFLDFFYRKWFDYEYMREFYEKIKVEMHFFDDDILRYIAFIAALNYFKCIGDPSFDTWLHAIDINRPFHRETDHYKRANLLDFLDIKYGGNAIRSRLLFAWEIVI